MIEIFTESWCTGAGVRVVYASEESVSCRPEALLGEGWVCESAEIYLVTSVERSKKKKKKEKKIEKKKTKEKPTKKKRRQKKKGIVKFQMYIFSYSAPRNHDFLLPSCPCY